MIRENQIIYTYLHLAAAKELTLGLMKSKSVILMFELFIVAIIVLSVILSLIRVVVGHCLL